jgi:aldehyde:ferredoxin oxidoreductase
MLWTESKILQIDLTEGSIRVEKVDSRISSKYIGGRGYGTRILFDSLSPGTDPLCEDNILVIMNGPLTGLAPTSGRCSLTSRSPLTNTICSCSVGGKFGVELGKAGYAGIVFKGKSSKPVYLDVVDEKVQLKPAGELWGMNTEDSSEKLLGGRKGSTAVIGPAGENLVPYASVMVDAHRAAGRGGLGAVFGSKLVKGIVVSGSGSIDPVNKFAFDEIRKECMEILRGNPVTGDGLHRFGTLILLNPANKHGIFPIKNARAGMSELAGEISGETLQKYVVKKGGCAKCPIVCEQTYRIGETLSPLEYESTWALGPQCGIWDPETILKANKQCNLLGLDTISCGNTIGFCMELAERKLLPEKFGYGANMEELIQKIALKEEEGELISLGTKRIAEKVGGKDFALNVKGMELPAYDPRGVKGQALAFATSNRGGDHLQAYMFPIEVLSLPRYLDNLSEEEKPRMVRDVENVYAVLDSLCMCKFTSMAIFSTFNFEAEIYAKLLTTATGFYFDEKELKLAGERIFNLERLFNLREGFSRKDDVLPRRFSTPMGSGALGNITVDISRMLSEYYHLRGWDDDGAPLEGKLQKLGLSTESWPKTMLVVNTDSSDFLMEEYRKYKTDWIGIGSLTIKAFGMDSIRNIKKTNPDCRVFADMKVMDTGFMEIEIAALAGADIISISALADDTTIIDAVGAGKKYKVKILADLLEAPPERSKQLEKLGVDYILCKPAEVNKLKKILSIPVASTGDKSEIQIKELTGLKTRAAARKKPCMDFSEPLLQVALDFRELSDALRIGMGAVSGGADWIEAGTPLIKCEGVKAVRELRNRFPDKVIISDLKTLKGAKSEVNLAISAGADIIGISGASANEEIVDAVKEAEKLGVLIMADLIAIDDPVSRAKELESIGVDLLEFHIAIDKQMRSDYEKIPFPLVKKVCDVVRIPVAVAGGMKIETAPLAVKSGAKIVVVGGGITHAADPKSAAHNIKKAMLKEGDGLLRA